MNRQKFFHNFVEIVTYAIIGTVLATVFTGLLFIASKKLLYVSDISTSEILAYSALISAVDPVAVLAIM